MPQYKEIESLMVVLEATMAELLESRGAFRVHADDTLWATPVTRKTLLI